RPGLGGERLALDGPGRADARPAAWLIPRSSGTAKSRLLLPGFPVRSARWQAAGGVMRPALAGMRSARRSAPAGWGYPTGTRGDAISSAIRSGGLGLPDRHSRGRDQL